MGPGRVGLGAPRSLPARLCLLSTAVVSSSGGTGYSGSGGLCAGGSGYSGGLCYSGSGFSSTSGRSMSGSSSSMRIISKTSSTKKSYRS